MSTDKKKVLCVVHAPKWGGIHAVAERVAPLCAEMNYEWVVVLPNEDGDNGSTRLEAAGIRTISIPLRRIRKTRNAWTHLRFLIAIPGDIFRLWRLIRSENADIVQVGGLIHFHSAVAGRLAGRAVVWQLHSDQPPPMLRRFFSPLVRALADTVMTSGGRIVHSHPGLGRMGNRIFPFLAPVDIDRFRPDAERRRAARAEIGAAEGDVVVGAVGGRGPNKNHRMLVEVAKMLHGQIPRIRVRFFGGWLPQHRDAYQRDVVDYAAALGLAADGTVGFVEPGNRVDYFMPGLDLFALPSRAEGISLVTGEAMSCGVPAVVNDVGSLSDLVVDGEVGLLNRSCGAQEMAGHILHLAQNESLRLEMGRRARKRAEMLLGERACASIHVAAYEAALARRGGTRTSDVVAETGRG